METTTTKNKRGQCSSPSSRRALPCPAARSGAARRSSDSEKCVSSESWKWNRLDIDISLPARPGPVQGLQPDLAKAGRGGEGRQLAAVGCSLRLQLAALAVSFCLRRNAASLSLSHSCLSASLCLSLSRCRGLSATDWPASRDSRVTALPF